MSLIEFIKSLFSKKKKTEEVASTVENDAELQKEVDEILTEEEVETPHEDAEKEIASSLKKEEKVMETPKVEIKEKDTVSLSETMAAATGNNAKIKLTKKDIAAYTKETFGDQVEIALRANYTKGTKGRKLGLPLADTYYVKEGKKRICIAFVYELVNNSTFLLLKCDEKTANEIRKAHAFPVSNFPKTTKGNKWYTLVIDDAFDSKEAVYALVSKAISGTYKLGDKAPVTKNATFTVKTLYCATNQAKELYMLTSYNNWDFAKAIKLDKVDDNTFTTTQTYKTNTKFEFKICRKEDWEDVEKGIWKEEIVNHICKIDNSDVEVEDLIYNFREN